MIRRLLTEYCVPPTVVVPLVPPSRPSPQEEKGKTLAVRYSFLTTSSTALHSTMGESRRLVINPLVSAVENGVNVLA